MKILKRVFLLILIVFLIVFISFLVYFFSVASSVKLDNSVMKQPKVSLDVYDKFGEKISLTRFKDNLTYDEIPKNLVDAFVCVEDKKFFSHKGVDGERLMKALVKNIISLSNKEGASTITQQFIKNTHLSIDKTLERKIKEIALSVELEKNYSKEEIITAYFNILYFGNSVYGVKNASKIFFNKDVQNLTLSECACLAGVVKNPARYSPVKNIEKSIERRNFVLSEMNKDGYISESEYNDAKKEELKLVKTKNQVGLSYLNCVLEECSKLLGISEKELAYSNYKIYTNYDPNLQTLVENNLTNDSFIPKNISGDKCDTFSLVVDNDTGLACAYYNSTNVCIEDFKRQPGSTIKPFLSYLPNLSAGKIHLASPVLDQKKKYGEYAPSNFGDKYIGWTDIRSAISKSINTVAVELVNDFGVSESIEYAKKFGLTFSKDDYNLSTALGGMTDGVSPIEITSAYMTLANQGLYKNIGFVKKIESKDNKTLYQNNSNEKRVETKENTYLMTDALQECARRGTASRLNVNQYNVASKTGTASMKNKLNNDIWNLSYTTENTICVWMGNASGKASGGLAKNSLASVYPTGIAKNVLNHLYKDHYPRDFDVPNGVVELPYSKYEYDNEHVLISPSEFSVIDEVSYDIFNQNVMLPSVSDVEIKEEFDSLEINYNHDRVNIIFNAKQGVNYSIKRLSLNEEWIEIENFAGNNETVYFEDKKITYESDYVYKIEAYVINYKNEIKYLGTSDEIYLAIPFELWN